MTESIGVVHLTGGLCALIAVWILGPRTGRYYDSTGKLIENPTRIKGTSVSLQVCFIDYRHLGLIKHVRMS